MPEGIPDPKPPSSEHDAHAARRPLSEAKLRKIMRDHGPRLLALARGVVRDTHLAEDIVQESFVKLWRQPPEAEAATASWLRTTVVRASIDRIRKRQATPSETLNPSAPESPPVADAQEQAIRIEQADKRRVNFRKSLDMRKSLFRVRHIQRSGLSEESPPKKNKNCWVGSNQPSSGHTPSYSVGSKAL